MVMTSNEAVIRTHQGIWNNIGKYIREKIENACDDGDYETRVETLLMSQGDIMRLNQLGYRVILNEKDEFPEYIINWLP